MNSIGELRGVASSRLNEYTNRAGSFAFNTYDVAPPNPGGPLRAEDILVANLLSLRLGWREVTPLFAELPESGSGPAGDKTGAPQTLLARMNGAIVSMRSAPPFEEIESEAELKSIFKPLVAANEAALSVSGWTAVTVSKVLHRHLHHIVPIVDSRVRRFYRTHAPEKLRTAMWKDVRENREWLSGLAREYRTSDQRALTVLRLVDIIIWTPDPVEKG